MTEPYPRDLIGYGRKLPDPQWPGGARLAIVFAVNYEAGGESNILHGDAASEGALSDTPFPAQLGRRNWLVESAYEYGSRRGIWRLFDLFQQRQMKVCLFGVVMALERNPEVARAFAEAGHEIVAHGYKWIDHAELSEADERAYMARAVAGIERIIGKRPVGWMTGRPSMRTRELIVEEGGFLYDRDALNDELPYWVRVHERDHLVIPYSYESNDMRFGSSQGGFVTGRDFCEHLTDAFDQLYEEGAVQPKLMSIGLHERTVGRPARARGLAQFLDHVRARSDVWVATGQEIAEHWRRVHPPLPRT